MEKSYNVFLLYKSILKPIEFVQSINRVNSFLLLLPIMIGSSVMAILNFYIHSDQIHTFTSLNFEKISCIIVGVIGAIAPLFTIMGYFCFYYVVSLFLVIESEKLKRSIFFISTISYTPILFASLLNVLLNIFFEYRPTGFTNLTFLSIDFPNMTAIFAEIDIFKIISAFLLGYLFTVTFSREKIEAVIYPVTWVVLNVLVALI
ncbi:conserved hypothetical protein [Bacillus subtilis subsp. subtilis str. RO-NN-1]|uniref:hypothetical protein n=1 Tax=Bacillus subtilis TaxID=1423 RepID=UPI00022BBCBF|nr:hypothetical protein [Bacillus subtilis]AEP90298.1 conserved hypothetical protein [Bacillus subtilis subsp. subtilis str. RO-NN-1]UVZ59156.1 hypothetical protein NYR91_06395 [Bacillus subtilis]